MTLSFSYHYRLKEVNRALEKKFEWAKIFLDDSFESVHLANIGTMLSLRHIAPAATAANWGHLLTSMPRYACVVGQEIQSLTPTTLPSSSLSREFGRKQGTEKDSTGGPPM